MNHVAEKADSQRYVILSGHEIQLGNREVDAPWALRNHRNVKTLDVGGELREMRPILRVDIESEKRVLDGRPRMKMEADYQGITGCHVRQRLPTGIKEFKLGKENVARATTRREVTEIKASILTFGKGIHVRSNDLAGIAVIAKLPLINPDDPRTQVLYGRKVMGYENDSPAPLVHFTHGAKAFSLEITITDSQNLVHQENL